MPTIPLMSQWDSIENGMFCSKEIMSHQADCLTKHCECTQVLNVTLNSVVELILIDEGNRTNARWTFFFSWFSIYLFDLFYISGTTSFLPNHPFHLHGHFFRVIAEQRLDGVVTVDRVKQLDRDGKIKRNLKDAPLKDTTKVPGGGFTIVRFYANNPGKQLIIYIFVER